MLKAALRVCLGGIAPRFLSCRVVRPGAGSRTVIGRRRRASPSVRTARLAVTCRRSSLLIEFNGRTMSELKFAERTATGCSAPLVVIRANTVVIRDGRLCARFPWHARGTDEENGPLPRPTIELAWSSMSAPCAPVAPHRDKTMSQQACLAVSDFLAGFGHLARRPHDARSGEAAARGDLRHQPQAAVRHCHRARVC